MKRFNLSGWAVSHPTLVLFLIIALGVAGFFSYQQLGRAEDPSFTIKVVNVSAIWPGATAPRCRRRSPTPSRRSCRNCPTSRRCRPIRSRRSRRCRSPSRTRPRRRTCRISSICCARSSPTCRASCRQGLIGPIVNDEFGDVDSILYMMTGDGADYAQLKKVAEGLRQRLLKVPGVTKVNLYGTQDERIFVEFSHAKLATLGITPQALFDSLAKQNAVTPGRHGRDLVAARAAARHRRARRRQGGGRDAGREQRPRVPPRRHRDRHARLRRSPDLHRAPGRQARARHRRRHGQGRQHPRARQGRREGHRRIHEGGAAGHRCRADRRPAEGGRARRRRVRALLRRGAGDRAVRQLPLARLAHRHRGGAVGAAGARDRLHRHERDVARPAPHHARRADHRARPAGRRRHHRGRDDGGEDGAGLGPRARGVLCLGIDRVPDADRNAGHGRWLPADRLCQFGGRRICRRHLLGRGDRAGRVLVRRRDLHALYRRQAAAEHQGQRQPRSARDLRDPHVPRPARASCSGASITASRWWSRPSASSRSRSSASATCSSSSSRCRSGPNCSCSCACRKAPPSTSPKRP